MPITQADVVRFERAWAAARRLPTKEQRNERVQEIFVEFADVIKVVQPDGPVEF